ncbi:Zn(II)2Cys6 transcription factor [Aspergillus brunneoviolaceus CBS 621.78]|uniref:Zn(II)2Cys6 transcription factor n=1 Tax=Aspergillus brunneoviolaceus CBS 621.78 TaxID=1450534 RepID=A0ACD1G5Q0_9EURO|nr:Zn(II)2Cys6 transcription factor [Aspergillus brunneoviolaceus CBS 621.78]RAH44558.1 Zn(II)2Cys6 transcription factor [Aspergillus brunneoviolaceus CBS 621.78]
MQASARKARRTANACVACRQSKIKCSGEQPCINCQRRSVRCEFAEGVNRVVVSERFVHCGQRSFVLPDGNRSPAPDICDAWRRSQQRSTWTSPFALPSTTIKNTKDNKRTWIWLAPSSMWSFTTRLTILMTEKLHRQYPHNAPTLRAKEIYPLRWEVLPASRPPDIADLPSLDYSLYLFNTVKFHLGQLRFFSEEQFVERLQEFYHGNPVAVATEYRLWFIQLLLVLSFGTALLCRSKSPDQPPGSRFFARAMSLMPDHASLWKDSLLAIEVLALASLYLYSIDQRESAHIYLGQAIRIAQYEGMHTQLSEEQLGSKTVARCRSLWWTLYIMDRHFSYSVGLPMTTQDRDISTPIDPPEHCSQQDLALSLHAKLSRLLSYILSTVYNAERTQLHVFLDTTKSILQTLAGYAQEMEEIIQIRLRNSLDTMPRGTQHITLLYHQCVIVATRPLLLSSLIDRLETLTHDSLDTNDFLALTKPLLCIGIKSAVKTIEILSGTDSLLEVFLLYDLEFTYDAAIHLALAGTLFPELFDTPPTPDSPSPSPNPSHQAHSILDAMIHHGNRIALARKEGLMHLERLLDEVAVSVAGRGRRPDRPGRPSSSSWHTHTPASLQVPAGELGGPSFMAVEDPQLANVEFLEQIGISSAEFLSIVAQIGPVDGVDGVEGGFGE